MGVTRQEIERRWAVLGLIEAAGQDDDAAGAFNAVLGSLAPTDVAWVLWYVTCSLRDELERAGELDRIKWLLREGLAGEEMAG